MNVAERLGQMTGPMVHFETIIGKVVIFLLTFAISYVILLNVMDPTASPCQRGWHGKTFYANCNGANGDVAVTDHGYTVYGEPLWMVPVIVLNRGKRGWGE